MKMKGSLPSLRGDEPFEMNAKLEGDLLTWGMNPADFVGRAHAVRPALQAQKRKLGAAKGFMHFKNLQLNFFDATTFAYRTLNAGVAETTGGELQANWATAIEGLTLSAAIAYNDASYKEFLAPCYGANRSRTAVTSAPALSRIRISRANPGAWFRSGAATWASTTGIRSAAVSNLGLPAT